MSRLIFSLLCVTCSTISVLVIDNKKKFKKMIALDAMCAITAAGIILIILIS